MPQPDLTHLAHALTVLAISRAAPEDHVGHMLAVLRSDTMIGANDGHVASSNAAAVYDDIMSLGLDDMPPPTDIVAVLLETVSQRRGGISRASVWRSIGINPNRGRDLMARSASAVDWPIWYTLRQAALGEDKELPK